MAVISKTSRANYLDELQSRFQNLANAVKGRDLLNQYEGAGRRGSYWKEPDRYCYIDSSDLRLAIEDFKTILTELKRLKE